MLQILRVGCWVVCALVFPSVSQGFYIHLHGIITEHFTGEAMKNIQVRLVKDSVDRETVITGNNGKYDLYLERGYDYQVWFHRADLVTKHVVIDAREVPLFPDVPFYDMDLQMTMFMWFDGFDFGIFDAPVARASYKHSVRNLNWDDPYTSKIRPRIERTMIHYEREVAILRKKEVIKGSVVKRGKRKPVEF